MSEVQHSVSDFEKMLKPMINVLCFQRELHALLAILKRCEMAKGAENGSFHIQKQISEDKYEIEETIVISCRYFYEIIITNVFSRYVSSNALYPV